MLTSVVYLIPCKHSQMMESNQSRRGNEVNHNYQEVFEWVWFDSDFQYFTTLCDHLIPICVKQCTRCVENFEILTTRFHFTQFSGNVYGISIALLLTSSHNVLSGYAMNIPKVSIKYYAKLHTFSWVPPKFVTLWVLVSSIMIV